MTSVITTHRILFIAENTSDRKSMAIPLRRLKTVSSGGGGLWNSPKIDLFCFQVNTEPAYRISFRNGGRDAFLIKTHEVLSKRAWETAVSITESSPTDKKPKLVNGGERTQTFRTSAAGISGLQRAQDVRTREGDAALVDAFSNLDNLMKKAEELVQLSERILISVENRRSAKEEGSNIDPEARELQLYREALHDLGITNPVTREVAGTKYHEELSRQLCDFLMMGPFHESQRHEVGLLPLPDVYCMYNRARGTDLISPQDLLDACKCFGRLGLVVSLKEFASGVRCVQAPWYSEDKTTAIIRDSITKAGFMSAVDFATAISAPLSLALQQLLQAESQGILCRDDTLEATFFYPNIFQEVEL
eukprot:Rmarinus@m.12757